MIHIIIYIIKEPPLFFDVWLPYKTILHHFFSNKHQLIFAKYIDQIRIPIVGYMWYHEIKTSLMWLYLCWPLSKLITLMLRWFSLPLCFSFDKNQNRQSSLVIDYCFWTVVAWFPTRKKCKYPKWIYISWSWRMGNHVTKL